MEASTSTSHVSPSIGPLDPVADYCDDEASQLAISLDQIMNFNTKANIAEAEEQDKKKDKENEGSLPHRHLLPSAFSSSSSSQRNKQRNRRRRRRAGAGRRRRRRKSNSSHGFNSTVCFQEAAKTALSATLGCRKALHRRITYRCNPYSSLSRRLLEYPMEITHLRIGESKKIYVTNLATQVTDEDLQRLFSPFGIIKEYGVHYDRDGNPKGSAMIEYVYNNDAYAAIQQMNGGIIYGQCALMRMLD